jgi:hypothetical protein
MGERDWLLPIDRGRIAESCRKDYFFSRMGKSRSSCMVLKSK